MNATQPITSYQLLLTVIVILASVALLPKAQAVSPPPDGGYPGGNTAEGQVALCSLATGGFNTAFHHQPRYVQQPQTFLTS
jgi:hypothetical protein